MQSLASELSNREIPIVGHWTKVTTDDPIDPWEEIAKVKIKSDKEGIPDREWLLGLTNKTGVLVLMTGHDNARRLYKLDAIGLAHQCVEGLLEEEVREA